MPLSKEARVFLGGGKTLGERPKNSNEAVHGLRDLYLEGEVHSSSVSNLCCAFMQNDGHFFLF